MKGEMVQIVSFELDRQAQSVTPYIDSDKMIKILNDRRVNDSVPFLVVSIIGTLRSGKSFLAGALIRFLDYLEKNPNAEFNGWMKQSVEMSGVEWKNSRKSVTRGIWMWNQPFILSLGKDQKIGVLLLDCQGLHDLQFPSKAVDSMLTLAALSFSKIHIVNMVGVTRTFDLDNLENCIRFYQNTQRTRRITEIFNTLVLVHRDWESDTRTGRRVSSPDDESDEDDDDDEDDEGPADAQIRMINGAFNRVIDFMMPTPGRKIRQGSVKDGRLLSEMVREPESKEFFQCMSDLFLLLTVKLPREKKKSSVLTSRKELINIVKKLRSNYGNGDKEFPLGSNNIIFERMELLGVQDEIEQKLAVVESKIIIHHLKNKEELLGSLSAGRPELDHYISQRKSEIRAASQVPQTPEHTASMEELWEMVECKADLLFSSLQKRKIEEMKEHEKKKTLNVVKVVVPTLLGLTALGLATGGVGAVAVGVCAVAGATGGGAVGVVAAAATATRVAVAKKKGEEEQIEREKKEL